MFKTIYLILLSFTICSCMYIPSENYTVRKKKLPVKNSNIYIFNSSLENVVNALKLNKNAIHDGIMEQLKSSYLKNNFEKDYPNDFIIRNYVTYSKMYVAEENNKPLKYISDFRIHLVDTDSTRTLVQVIAYNSRVGIGDNSWFLFGDIPREMTKVVETSSIEEYEILLNIGDLLGEKNMPEVLVPKEYQTKESSTSKKVRDPWDKN